MMNWSFSKQNTKNSIYAAEFEKALIGRNQVTSNPTNELLDSLEIEKRLTRILNFIKTYPNNRYSTILLHYTKFRGEELNELIEIVSAYSKRKNLFFRKGFESYIPRLKKQKAEAETSYSK